MTRFARAKGSKSSNERLPEQATSWQEMKQQMLQKDPQDNTEGRTSIDTKTSSEPNTITEWAEFPENRKRKNQKTDKKANKKLKSNEAVKVEGNNNNENLGMEEHQNIPKERKLKKNKKAKKDVSETDANLELVSPDISKKKKKAKGITDTEPNLVESPEDNAGIPNKKHKSNKFQNKKEASNHDNNNETKDNFRGNKFKNHSTQSKFPKEKNNLDEYKRRKPKSETNVVYINGNTVEIEYYDGFPIKKTDAEHLKQLRKEMISRGLPRSEINKALKLERRKAEKALAREKKKVCFNCRQSGHILSECPTLKEGVNAQMSETGICFKCGSTEHAHFECRVVRGDNFKFAQCFICKEQGHISRQCPDNNRGLYPKGGACKVCGNVTHLKKDCPKYQMQQEGNKVVADTIDGENIESLGDKTVSVDKKPKKFQKVIKF